MKIKNFLKLIMVSTLFTMAMATGLKSTSVQALAATIDYVPSLNPANINDTIELKVNVSNLTNLYGASLDFKYDPSVLQIVEVKEGDLFLGKNFTSAQVNSNKTTGDLSFYATLLGGTNVINSSTSGNLFTIKAKFINAGSFTLKTISDNGALSSSGNNMRIKLSDNNGAKITYSANAKTINSILPPVKLTSVTTNVQAPRSTGESIIITAKGTGINLLYRFWIKDEYGWKIVKDYSSSNTYTWTPSKVANYGIWVDLKSSYSTKDAEDSSQFTFNILDKKAETELKIKEAQAGKNFYRYNVAYAAILKNYSNNIALRDTYLGQIVYLWNVVNTPDVIEVRAEIEKLANNRDLGAYNKIEYELINKITLQENRDYILGELDDWGRNYIWTSNVTAAVTAVNNLWANPTLANKTLAEQAISKVESAASRQYLLAEISKVVIK